MLLPENLKTIEEADFKICISNLWEKYKSFLLELNGGFASETSFISEVEMWKLKCLTINTDKNLIDIYKTCDKDIYSNCELLFRVLLCMPISIASAERSFSALRRLKTYLRNRMSETRLLGLALLHIHWDIELDPEKILDRFAATYKRKLNFVL